ncbi:hypothetical protein Tco_0222707 [Tanacetum coccineum]
MFQMSSMETLTFFLGLQVQQKKKGIFISQDKYVHEILRKYNFTDVKSASTQTDLEKPLVQDGDAADVDEHLVSKRQSHLLAVKRIFRYLKGKTSLGLWNSKDSPWELVAYTDSDYGLEQQKQTVVATSTTEAEYVVAANCCRQKILFNIPKTKTERDRHHFYKETAMLKSLKKDLMAEDDTEHKVAESSYKRKEGFSHVIIFQIRSHIFYALTKKPDVYISFIKQFWRSVEATANANGEVQITASIDVTQTLSRSICQEVDLFPTMLHVHEPSTSPSRIASSASYSPEPSHSHSHEPSIEHSPDHTTAAVSFPSLTQPTQPSPGAEQHIPTPHDSPLHAVHSHGSDEGSLKLIELTNLVTNNLRELESWRIT